MNEGIMTEQTVKSLFSERLARVVHYAGGVDNVAERSGMSASAVRNYLRGRIPQIDTAIRIAQSCGIDPAWLVVGHKEKNLTSPGTLHPPAFPCLSEKTLAENNASGNALPEGNPGDHQVLIPFYDVEASAGNGLTSPEYPQKTMVKMSRDFLERILDISPIHAYIISARGDSMEPTIRSGARLVLDTRPTNRLEGIFALVMNGDLYVKRLHMIPGRVIISSDNSLYRDIEIPRQKIIWGETAAPDEVGILGQVVHMIQSV